MRVDPDGIELDLEPGETLIEAAWRLGYTWPTRCYGQAECTACHIEVMEGAEHASAIGEDEAVALATLRPGTRALRLACRIRFDGDAVVKKRGVRAPF